MLCPTETDCLRLDGSVAGGQRSEQSSDAHRFHKYVKETRYFGVRSFDSIEAIRRFQEVVIAPRSATVAG